ncbi:MAG: PIN domain-containing protein [Desulfurococcales archaeon]|nr:PIN domain-containing protein [Desulfurococcales archaeon]
MIIDVVVDTNIIISALLTPGRVRRVLLNPEIRPHAPRLIIEETIRQAGKISRYMGIDETILKPLLQQALPRWITTYKEEVISSRVKEEARRLVGSVDPDD